jgi:hypothetical protein
VEAYAELSNDVHGQTPMNQLFHLLNAFFLFSLPQMKDIFFYSYVKKGGPCSYTAHLTRFHTEPHYLTSCVRIRMHYRCPYLYTHSTQMSRVPPLKRDTFEHASLQEYQNTFFRNFKDRQILVLLLSPPLHHLRSCFLLPSFFPLCDRLLLLASWLRRSE